MRQVCGGSAGSKQRRHGEVRMSGDVQRQIDDVWNSSPAAILIQTELVGTLVLEKEKKKKLSPLLTEQQETKYLLTKYLILTL